MLPQNSVKSFFDILAYRTYAINALFTFLSHLTGSKRPSGRVRASGKVPPRLDNELARKFQRDEDERPEGKSDLGVMTPTRRKKKRERKREQSPLSRSVVHLSLSSFLPPRPSASNSRQG